MYRLRLEYESITNVSLRIISSLNTSRNCLWWGYFLIKTQEYCQQPKFLLNSITDVFMRVFWNSCTKNFGTIPEKRMLQSFLLINLYDHSLHHTGLETPLKILFWKCLGRKECSNTSKISKRSLCKTTPFSLPLQACSSEFLVSTKSNLEKNVSCDSSLK